MRNVLLDLLDQMLELVYVSDVETYELLYINSAGKKKFGIDSLHGKKCYQVLQGLDAPCSFCTNDKLCEESVYTWEFTNQMVGRHYLLKDKLVDWNGRKARIEIATDITENQQEKVALKNALQAEMVIQECVRRLYETENLSEAIDFVLGKIGSFLMASRAYVFEIRGDKMYNTYEWCAPGITPEMGKLQELDISVIDRWRVYFDECECVVVEDLEDIKEVNREEYDILSMQGITSLVTAPLEQDGKLIGYFGVDNPPTEKIRNIVPLFHTLRYFLMSTIRRIEDERLLTRLSFEDMLTGFYNRNRYMQDLVAFNNEEKIGIAYVDVNGLKNLNDEFGHSYGDKVLVECARNIEQVFGTGDFYRIGGDEFIVICRGVSKEHFYENIRELKNQFASSESCQAAIGYQWAEKAGDVQRLIYTADAMMYEDKKQFYRKTLSSDRYRHYNDDVLGLTKPAVLKGMIDEGRFKVYLQPKVSFADRSLIGAEALVRYQVDKDVVLAPGQFLPVLEDAKVIGQLDFYVFEYTCSKIAEWLKKGKKIVPISVNFSRYTLVGKDFLNRLKNICDKHGIDKELVEIEITESVKGTEGIDMIRLIDKIKEEGFVISIDDFGVNYANLSLFTSIDFDVLKIDKSLAENIQHNRKAQMVIESIAGICRKMDIRMVVEGVETEDQFNILNMIGCEQAQGYLFSRPMPMEEYEAKYI
ncbi:MAG: bifunctional diguanylate cyclase/phosphodiesterase [Christensenella sp.]|uniref:bifunctional diguanylate cyclase/phosphodiesterase n=1 Tax=Christensenella sp. TaxID=1935934 RepID=UPI002B202700|nr:bifunctional diguanylate cyclase/phosphodiesterase [Christensenella sp.]MEA5003988.1 bifunctional diguanylate cyclase/phosphodiesterase [Christensenella sp.]